MRNLLVLALCLFVGSVVMSGCGKKSDSEEGKVPADVKQAESMDSTRLDSADHSMMNHDSVGQAVDEHEGHDH